MAYMLMWTRDNVQPKWHGYHIWSRDCQNTWTMPPPFGHPVNMWRADGRATPIKVFFFVLRCYLEQFLNFHSWNTTKGQAWLYISIYTTELIWSLKAIVCSLCKTWYPNNCVRNLIYSLARSLNNCFKSPVSFYNLCLRFRCTKSL